MELPTELQLGRYVVRRRLGEGGFARVYLAWDPDLEIEVAIKLPKPQLAADLPALERFRREATTAARLRHPNVVTVLTVGRLDEPFDGVPAEAPYLVMDYLPQSLSARLLAATFLPEADWLRVGAEIARGLAYAHGEGVVHRDVKPDNILFGRHGEAVVTDFGIARAVLEGSSPLSRSIIIGTPEYFSPEQARGLPLDGRTDVYALGVTLYRAATGALPFAGPDWYAIMRQHVEDEPPPPRSINAEMSPAAEAVILRCLAKAPDDRFQSADDIARTLSALQYPGYDARSALAASSATIQLPGPTRMLAGQRGPLATSRVRRRVALGAAIVLGTAAIGMWASTRRTLVATVGQATEAPPVAVPPPPAVADSVAAPRPAPVSDSIRAGPPVATVASLTVVAPPKAVVTLNGRSVGLGTWRSSALPFGRYQVRASIPALPNCGVAIDEATIDLGRGAPRTLRLNPTGCGALVLNVSPVPAHYTLSGDAGTVLADGDLPLATPLVVPEGSYRLVIERRACGRYDDRVRVPASLVTHVERIKLICQ